MQKQDYAEFVSIWNAVCELYDRKPHDAAVALAFRALRRFELSDVRRALDAHLNNADEGRFMPKPADVIRFIEGSGCSRAQHAWTSVEWAVKHIGSYSTVVFDDPLTHAVIEDMGGWVSLCRSKTVDMPYRANDFSKRYGAYVLRPPTEHPKKLIGTTEQHNRISGMPIEPPVVIGNRQKAIAVFKSGNAGQQHIEHKVNLRVVGNE